MTMYGKKLTVSAVFLAVCTLLISGCFSPWKGEDEATLTISVGSGSSRVLVNTSGNEQAGFSYEVIMTGPGGEKTFRFDPGATALTVKVSMGKYKVEVRAIGTSNLPGFSNPALRAFGEWEGTVSPGGNTTASVTMYSAMEVTSWAQLRAATNTPADGDRKEIILLKGSSWTAAGSSIDIRRPIELRAAEAVTITRDAGFTNRFFNLSSGGTDVILTLKGPLTLNGNFISSDEALITINSDNVEVIMYDGVILQNNINSTGFGGGVYVGSSGNLTMHGGTISGNESRSGNGGGVYFSGSGIFKMYGGTISGNIANTSYGGAGYAGGGVYVGAGTFDMHGGLITNNEANYGGGVYVQNGTLTMKEGIISSNTSHDISLNDNFSYGGGVYVYGGNFIMDGGTISGNLAKQNNDSIGGGGGVLVTGPDGTNKGTFTMNGGSIRDNNTSGGGFPGGGVYVDENGIFNMQNGIIHGNTSRDNSGGGVYVDEYGIFNMYDGTISGNSSWGRGAGLFIFSGGIVAKTKGTIYGSSASPNLKNFLLPGSSGLGSSICDDTGAFSEDTYGPNNPYP